jgi:hypothetical protein
VLAVTDVFFLPITAGATSVAILRRLLRLKPFPQLAP